MEGSVVNYTVQHCNTRQAMAASLLYCGACPGVATDHASFPQTHARFGSPCSGEDASSEGSNLKLVSSPLWVVEWAANEFESSGDH